LRLHTDPKSPMFHLNFERILYFIDKSFFADTIETLFDAFSIHFLIVYFYYNHLFLSPWFYEYKCVDLECFLNADWVSRNPLNFYALQILTFWTVLQMYFDCFCLSFYLFIIHPIIFFGFIPLMFLFVIICLYFPIYILHLLG
jgi:hypothetical protein